MLRGKGSCERLHLISPIPATPLGTLGVGLKGNPRENQRFWRVPTIFIVVIFHGWFWSVKVFTRSASLAPAGFQVSGPLRKGDLPSEMIIFSYFAL